MRYYLIDENQDEHIIELSKTKVHTPELIQFEFSYFKDNMKHHTSTVYIRNLAGKYFSSLDGTSWSKITHSELPNKLLHQGRIYNLFRGFKPSGLSGGTEGELVSQMPGVVVKIPVQEGNPVKKGEPLIVIEAMKMENEIISGQDGTVKSIYVKEGQAIEQGIVLMEMESTA